MDKIIENKKLSSILSDPSLLKDKAYVAGEWVNSANGDTFEVRNPLFEGISNDSDFYFVHSFAQKSGRFAIGTTNVEDTIFTSVVNKENFYGVQFHPEKSGENGLKLLKNFASMT